VLLARLSFPFLEAWIGDSATWCRVAGISPAPALFRWPCGTIFAPPWNAFSTITPTTSLPSR